MRQEQQHGHGTSMEMWALGSAQRWLAEGARWVGHWTLGVAMLAAMMPWSGCALESGTGQDKSDGAPVDIEVHEVLENDGAGVRAFPTSVLLGWTDDARALRGTTPEIQLSALARRCLANPIDRYSMCSLSGIQVLGGITIASKKMLLDMGGSDGLAALERYAIPEPKHVVPNFILSQWLLHGGGSWVNRVGQLATAGGAIVLLQPTAAGVPAQVVTAQGGGALPGQQAAEFAAGLLMATVTNTVSQCGPDGVPNAHPIMVPTEHWNRNAHPALATYGALLRNAPSPEMAELYRLLASGELRQTAWEGANGLTKAVIVIAAVAAVAVLLVAAATALAALGVAKLVAMVVAAIVLAFGGGAVFSGPAFAAGMQEGFAEEGVNLDNKQITEALEAAMPKLQGDGEGTLRLEASGLSDWAAELNGNPSLDQTGGTAGAGWGPNPGPEQNRGDSFGAGWSRGQNQ